MADNYISSADSLEEFDPGFLHLSLNFMHITDVETLRIRQLYIEKAMSKENGIVHNVLRSILDLIDYMQARRRDKAIGNIEKRLKENKNHLNTIADLEFIYRELHRTEDAKKMEKLKNEILDDEERTVEKALFILEQGYAVLFEDSIDHESVCSQKLQDVSKILQTEIKTAEKERKDMLTKTHAYIRLARKSLTCAMECEREDERCKRNVTSTRMLCKGLDILRRCSYPEHLKLIWEFYLAKSYNRRDDSLTTAKDTDEFKKDTTNKAVEIFWRVVQEKNNSNFQAENKLYVARSYAYIGHIAAHGRRNEYIDIGNDRELEMLLQNPIKTFQKAIEIESTDEVVLNRYARGLFNMTRHVNNIKEEIQMLEQAYRFVSKSIKNQENSNWFAYVTRARICNDLAKQIADKHTSKKYLMEARRDGIFCFNTKRTPKDIDHLAKSCQQLAKFPDCWEYGPEYVKEIAFLHEAISYLNVAVQLGGMTNYFVCCTFGSCLYEVKEYRSAIEWMKRAMNLSKPKKLYAFCHLCCFLLRYYEEKKTSSEAGKGLMAEIFYVIEEGRRKHSETPSNLKGQICFIFKDKIPLLQEYLSFLISEAKHSNIFGQIVYLKESFANWRYFDVRYLESELQRLQIGHESQEEDEEVGPYVWKPSSSKQDDSNSSREYKYDFFVAHSSHDAGWVHGFLIHQLENKLHDDDSSFRGCIDTRDFTPGKLVTDNIMDALKNSFKIFLVLSPNFIKSDWCRYERDHAIRKSIEEKGNKDCVVPILLSDCEIPESLRLLNYVDLTDHSEYQRGMLKLKSVLLPDVEIFQ